MPSKSKKQHQFFEAVLHNPEFRAKVKVPKSVAEEFVDADKKEGLYLVATPSKAVKKKARK